MITHGDYFMLTVMTVTFLFFSYRFMRPIQKLQFTEDTIWTKAHGEQPWENLAGIAIEVRRGYRGIREPTLLLLFEPDEGVDRSKLELAYQFSDLSISELQFRRLLKGPLKDYMELDTAPAQTSTRIEIGDWPVFPWMGQMSGSQ